jgi:hypothetical protein
VNIAFMDYPTKPELQTIYASYLRVVLADTGDKQWKSGDGT